jgi:hypothetical protein
MASSQLPLTKMPQLNTLKVFLPIVNKDSGDNDELKPVADPFILGETTFPMKLTTLELRADASTDDFELRCWKAVLEQQDRLVSLWLNIRRKSSFDHLSVLDVEIPGSDQASPGM